MRSIRIKGLLRNMMIDDREKTYSLLVSLWLLVALLNEAFSNLASLKSSPRSLFNSLAKFIFTFGLGVEVRYRCANIYVPLTTATSF
jgi:hypothetical protein